MERSSRIPRFYKLSAEERLKIVKEYAGLTDDEVKLLSNYGNLDPKIAEVMIENVIGAISYPFAIAPNFRINGRDYLVPMVIEESSVVAAAANAAKVMRRGDGIISKASEQVMIGQIQVLDLPNPWYAKAVVLEHKNEIIKIANEQSPTLVSLGGGAIDVDARVLDSFIGPMLIIHVYVNVLDAMGANAVNSMVEALSPYIQELTGGRIYLRILSNLADRRLVRTRVKVYASDIGGEEVVNGIVAASAFAEVDPYRAATHNKGIMNGIIAVALATGQDHRAIEAGAHAYAAKDGRYTSLSRWRKDKDGNLTGYMEIPIQVGIVGGAVKVHPIARIALKILGVKKASELAEVMAAVGLAQNFAALKALATEGIQRGHMELHARNLAVMAGAEGELVDIIAEIMIRERRVKYSRARELVEEFTKSKRVGIKAS